MLAIATVPTGMLIGLSVAAPIGPMAILCIQRTLARGLRVGVSTGLGAATTNVVHATLVVLFLEQVSAWVHEQAHLVAAGSGAFLLWSATRLLWRARRPPTAVPLEGTPLGAFASAMLVNITNPLSLTLILALLSPALGSQPASIARGVGLVGGMFLGATIWWVTLTWMVSRLRARLTPAILGHATRLAGIALAGYGLLTLVHGLGR